MVEIPLLSGLFPLAPIFAGAMANYGFSFFAGAVWWAILSAVSLSLYRLANPYWLLPSFVILTSLVSHIVSMFFWVSLPITAT